MSFLPEDERGLLHALELARDAAAFASPNPTVGCVLTRDGETIGEGAHFYDNRAHAEIAALKQAAQRERSAKGATAYVTLEPCAHHGRTGPCADALITAGIARCVVATVDPNPQVSGKGLAKLRAAGVEVVIAEPSSAVAQQARRLNDAFAFSIQHGRPFVTLKAAVSLDGYLAPPPSTRMNTSPYWLTGASARADVQALRHASDAILTGIGTVLADNPSLTDRTNLPRRRPLLRVVMDSGLRIPEDVNMFATPGDLLICCHLLASDARVADLRRRGVEVEKFAGEADQPAIAAVLNHLAARGINSVLVEAGSTLNADFLQRDLVDRVVLYYADTELGAGSLPFARSGPSPYALQAELQRVERQSFPNGTAEDIRISGYRHDPWSNI